MKVLVVGGGGREHALVRKIKESKKVDEIFAHQETAVSLMMLSVLMLRQPILTAL